MHLKYVPLLFIILIVAQASELADTLSCLKDYIDTFQSKMDPKLFSMFSASYPNTLTTTVQHFQLPPANERTYIITGDIQAMWLRDSTNQFLPYMKITKDCPKIQQLALGLINTQAELIMTDAYTNAFKQFQQNIAQRHFYLNDMTETLFFGIPVDLSRHREFATKAIWERKFEIDSLASFLRLSYEYHKRYNSIGFVNINYFKALRRLLQTLQEQSKDKAYEDRLKVNFYTFYRGGNELKDGKIRPSYRTGMIKTGFRPSDDPNDLAYNVPGNAMMSTYLSLVAREVLSKVPENSIFKTQAQILGLKMKEFGQSIRLAIFQYGVVDVDGKKIFAYQVNGKGQFKAFDDANLPSLLSLPYLQFVSKTDQIYANTRAFILSTANPYFYQNGEIRGVGSSHTPPNSIWPLALVTQILTTDNKDEIRNCLQSLKAHSIDNLNHESFSVINPKSNTRSWFAWANSYFGEMIITLSQNHPDCLQ